MANTAQFVHLRTEFVHDIFDSIWIVRKYVYLFLLLSTCLRNLQIFSMYSFLSMHCMRFYLVKVNAVPLNFWLITFSYDWDRFSFSWSRRNTDRE